MLVHDREEVKKYWPSALILAIDLLVVVLIGPEFQIGEPGWVGFTFDCTFYAFNALFF